MYKKKLTNEELNLNKEEFINKLRIDEDDMQEFDEIFNHCISIVSAKYIVSEQPVTYSEENRALVGGVLIPSKIAAGQLKHLNYAYTYIVTCGRELYEYAESLQDPFIAYWLDSIMEAVLYKAIAHMKQYLRDVHYMDKIKMVNPGSTVDWHISGQKQIFEILKEGVDFTGVHLTSTFLMLPAKSASGIMYQSEEDYENCQYCIKKGCPNRRKDFISKKI